MKYRHVVEDEISATVQLEHFVCGAKIAKFAAQNRNHTTDAHTYSFLPRILRVPGRAFSFFHPTRSPPFNLAISGGKDRLILAARRKLARVLSSNSRLSAV